MSKLVFMGRDKARAQIKDNKEDHVLHSKGMLTNIEIFTRYNVKTSGNDLRGIFGCH